MVSKTDSPSAEAGRAEDLSRRPRGRGRWVVPGAVIVVAVGVALAWRAGVFSPADASAGQQGGSPPATAQVVRRDLSSTTPLSATLGYAGSYTVSGAGGTLTSLPAPGQVISQGQVLYETGNGSPVVLLYGTVPEWRAMQAGVTGADVAQLNHDLVALGYASIADVSAAGWDYFSAETGYGVQQLEEHLGVTSPSASLSPGQVVFEPAALRVSQLTGSLGGAAAGPVLQATSDQQVVTIALDTSMESQVQVGDDVSITLPDGASTPGVVSAVGTVATTSVGQNGPVTTIPVTVTLTDPAAAGNLDETPVTVYITTASVHDVLTVPVTALQAQPGGTYDVEAVGAGDARHWVPVTVGPVFDDNSGLVEVHGALTPGQRVVVASS